MAKKKIRLIARLDVKDTNLVKGIQLEGLRKLGDPNLFAREYYEQGIDELLYIDIVASLYNRNNLSDIVRKTVDDVYIPVCVGGGLRSVEDVRHILSMGADKVAINTAAIKRPELITEVANAFGSQCMVLSIQAKRNRTWPGKRSHRRVRARRATAAASACCLLRLGAVCAALSARQSPGSPQEESKGSPPR